MYLISYRISTFFVALSTYKWQSYILRQQCLSVCAGSFQALPGQTDRHHCGVLCRKGGPGKLRNFLIWEFRSMWQLLPNWQLMDLARERFRFRFRHPVDGWCVGGYITMAQCDPMESGVQASSGWMVHQRMLNHSGPVWSNGNHGMKLGFHGWGEITPQGSVYLVNSFFFFFSWAFFLSFFFFFLALTFFVGLFFSLFFLFLEITHLCIMHRVHTSLINGSKLAKLPWMFWFKILGCFFFPFFFSFFTNFVM